MIAPIDFSHIELALRTEKGWAELGLTFVCLATAWLIDTRVWGAQKARLDKARLHGSFARMIFPLTALAMVLIAATAYRRFVDTPFFLAMAAPLLIAMGALRMVLYGLRRLFPSQSWLPASERAIAFAAWILLALYFVGVLSEMAVVLDEIVLPLGKARVSLLTIGTAVLVVVFTLIVTLWISGIIEQRLGRATQIDVNLRVVLGKFVRAAMLVVGILISLQAIGFDLTLLSVFGGALGVGIGLGLQKLASNYIAGFTILLDRSIRLGDMVTVDGRFGAVSKVTSRYVVVTSLDGIEAIVPNETLVTTTVLNHSYSTRNTRVAIQVQISYDSDVDLALRIMEDIALSTPRVLGPPNAPAAFLANLPENGFTLELGVWINDPEQGQLALRSAINRAIFKAFSQKGIRLPYAQREVRIVGLPAGASIADVVPGERAEPAAKRAGAKAGASPGTAPDSE